jgi:4-alpha-glucanotransferase
MRIDAAYTDALGKPTVATPEVQRAVLDALGYDSVDDAAVSSGELQPVYVVCERDLATLPDVVRASIVPDIGLGYHDVVTSMGATRLIVTPERAYVPSALDAAPRWGYAAQLYSLRSEHNWGIGDFGDLTALARLAQRSGASAVALNPLHQAHLTNPAAASPYAPLSRRYLNALYIDIDDAARRCSASVEAPDLGGLRRATLIDYRGVAYVKLQALETIFATGTHRDAVRAFALGDPGLLAMATYEAIMEREVVRDASIYGWMQWPRELRDANGPGVAAFAREHVERIEFFTFLQWLADEQLARAAQAASSMAIGLYRDLAVGVDLASVDVWSDPGAFALDLAIGAPPDPLNEDGQNWGLPPFHPRALRDRAYEPFVTLLRANMRHAGALRIDHVMGLRRLFCMARSLPKAGGVYVNYDFDAMLGIVALESHINRCMVVGEDLGTVPDGFRERLSEARVFMCRVLFFEREPDGRFRAPDQYTRGAVASTGTHDLPTLAGRLAESDPESLETRRRLIEALSSLGLLDAASEETLTALLVATYRYLGRTRSELALVQLEDALGSREQVNVPGTIDEQPNWQRKLITKLEELEHHPIFAAIAQAMRDVRPLNERGS